MVRNDNVLTFMSSSTKNAQTRVLRTLALLLTDSLF